MRDITISSILATLITGAVGYYIYLKQETRPKVSWAVQQQIVVDYGSSQSNITVLDRDKNEITQNVYSDQFTIWNSGNVDLDNVDRTSRIRERLKFLAKGNAQILGASITTKKNEANGDWMLLFQPRGTSMVWTHFDRNAVAQVLVLYAGDKDSSVEPDMTLADGSLIQTTVRPKPQGSDRLLLGAMGLMCPFIAYWMYKVQTTANSNSGISNVLKFIVVGIGCLVVVLCGYFGAAAIWPSLLSNTPDL